MDRHILDLLLRYGAPLLFFAQMLGIFGLPIPDELLLTIAGVLVRRGTLNGISTLGCAISGSLVGITFSYLLGRSAGLRILQRMAGPHAEAVERVQAWFKRFGKWVLAFGYFVPGVRHVTAIAAGSSRLDFPSFAAYAYPGAVLWSTTFVAAGYYAGDRWERATILVRGHLTIVAIAAIAAAAVYVYARRRERT